jgi:hypothetical protein
MKKLFSFLFISLFILTYSLTNHSCTKPDGNGGSGSGTTTVAQDKEYINTSLAEINNCIKTIRDAEGFQTLFNFLDLRSGEVVNEDWIEEMFDELDEVMPTSNNEDRFEYSLFKGKYVWNHNTKTFTKFSSNIIVIEFPSEPNVKTNNMVASFDRYEDGLYQVNSESVYLPKKAQITVTKSGTKIAGLDLNAVYSTGGFPRPQNVLINLFIAPNNNKIEIKEVNSKQFTVNASFGCIGSMNAIINFNNDDYDNFEIEKYITKIDFEFKKDNFTIDGSWDARTFYLFDDPNTNDINSTITCNVKNGLNKIGELKFKDVSGERRVYVFYKDGTSGDAEIHYNSFTTSLKSTLKPYFGEDVDDWFDEL